MIVNVMFQPYLAIVPLCCLTATAIAVMLAEAFPGPGERMPMAPRGAIGPPGAGSAAIALWNSGATSFGMVAADNFGLFVGEILVVVGLLSLALSGPTVEREGLPQGEKSALML